MLKVGVDFKPVSSEAALRGMGRYTQQQLRETLSAAPDIEAYVFVHGPVPPENELATWQTYDRVHFIPVSVDGHDLHYATAPSYDTVLAYSRRLEELLDRFSIDVYHSTVPFMFPYYADISACPVISTFYDAIPLIFPSDYFGNKEQRTHYLRCIENVRNSDAVAAISESAANDLYLYTGYPREKTRIIYPLIEPVFYARSEQVRDEDAEFTKTLPERFVLSVTGIHKSKNVKVLVESFLLASAALHPDCKLVIVFPSQFARSFFIAQYGEHERFVLLADITDAQLNLLYRRAEMVVQPSLYEGFGYPVAEAMACGNAVIATTSSSIPEIAGDAALLVPPSEPDTMAAAIVRIAQDSSLRDNLRGRAQKQVAQFADPSRPGAATADLYKTVARGRTGPRRASVAAWSSMPPLDCGVADYTSELISELATTDRVDVFVDGTYAPDLPSSSAIRYRSPESYDAGAYAATIFQMGARNYQEFMYSPLRSSERAVAVLHDVSMGLGFYFLALATGKLEEFEDEIVLAEGRKAYEGYSQLRFRDVRDRSKLEEFFGSNKLLHWVVRNSSVLVVHTEGLRQRVLDDYPDASCQVVRMGVRDVIPQHRHNPVESLRLALGVGEDGLCIGCFGIVDRVKRLDVVLRAFQTVLEIHPSSVLLIVGQCYDDKLAEELHEIVHGTPAAKRVLMLDRVPRTAFDVLLGLTDVVINLRTSDRMGLSAILIRALAAAKPVVVSDIPEWAGIAADACVRIPAGGPSECSALIAELDRLACSRDLRLRIGSRAREWYLHNATLGIMADDYRSVLKTVFAPAREENTTYAGV